MSDIVRVEFPDRVEFPSRLCTIEVDHEFLPYILHLLLSPKAHQA